MAVNKVIYGNNTLIDLTDSTVTPETLGEGVIAYNAKGERIVGIATIRTITAKLGEAFLGTMVLGGEE